MSGPIDHLDALDRALVAKGFPAMSPWWRATVARFYASGRRQLVLRVGRRGGKSSSLCRVAVLEALFGEHTIPPGDVGIVGVVSISRDEASQRLRTIRAILDALGIAYKPIDGGVELAGRPIVFKVFTASIGGVVGGTWICALCDEVALWRDSDTGANPATEVLGGLRPTMATQPHARIFLSSSALSNLDAHATAFDAGDSAFQLTAFAETWVANDTLTEAETRDLEPDEKLWRRNYACIPSAGTSNAFSPELIAESYIEFAWPVERLSNELILVDVSSGKKDTWSYGIGGWFRRHFTDADAYVFDTKTLPDGRFVRAPAPRRTAEGHFELNPEYQADPAPIFLLRAVGGIEGRFASHVSGDEIVDMLAKRAHAEGITTVVGDQRESMMIEAAFARRGIRFASIAYTAQNKGPEGVAWITRLLRERRIKIEPHEKLRRELLTFQEKVTPSGAIQYSGRTTDDYACLLITAGLADANGLFAGSPTVASRNGVTSSGGGSGDMSPHSY